MFYPLIKFRYVQFLKISVFSDNFEIALVVFKWLSPVKEPKEFKAPSGSELHAPETVLPFIDFYYFTDYDIYF